MAPLTIICRILTYLDLDRDGSPMKHSRRKFFIQEDESITGTLQVKGYARFWRGIFNVFAQIFDGLYCVSKVSITADQDGRVVQIPKGHFEHIHSDSNVHTFLDCGSSSCLQSPQAETEVRRISQPIKKLLLSLVLLRFGFGVHGGIVVIDAQKPPTVG